MGVCTYTHVYTHTHRYVYIHTCTESLDHAASSFLTYFQLIMDVFIFECMEIYLLFEIFKVDFLTFFSHGCK